MMIINSIRGGISQCMLRHAQANNPHIPDTYKEEEKKSYIMYYDVTALYAYTMCKPLPYQHYEWVKDEELDILFGPGRKDVGKVMSLPDDGPEGFIFEVDLRYNEELHDLHFDLPFCEENKVPPALGSKHPKLLTT